LKILEIKWTENDNTKFGNDMHESSSLCHFVTLDIRNIAKFDALFKVIQLIMQTAADRLSMHKMS